jgi:hypothetical protein
MTGQKQPACGAPTPAGRLLNIEARMEGKGAASVKTKQYDRYGRLLADQPARPKTDKVDVVLKRLFPPDGRPPPRDLLPDIALHLEVCNYMRDHWLELFPNEPYQPKELPSLPSVLRSELVGRAKRR